MSQTSIIIWMLPLTLILVREVSTSIYIVPAVGKSYLGEEKFFMCRTSGREATLIWKNPSKEEIDDSEDKFEIEVVDETTSKLIFKSVQIEDGGQYTCEASFSEGDKAVANVTVTVIKTPTFTNMNTTQQYLEGDDADIACDVEGIPSPEVTWTHNGHDISNRQNDRISIQANNHLQIKKIHRLDDGIYVCNASIREWNEVNSINISVLVDHSPVFEGNKTESLYAVTGRPVNFSFTISARPKATLSLTLNGTDIGTKQINETAKQGTTQHLYFQGIENDSGTYIVTARNKMGSASKTFIVRETDSPKKGIGTGGIVAIAIVIFLIVLIAVDVSFYYTNQCGMLMCIAINLLGKQPLEAKQINAEQGNVTVTMNQSNDKGCLTSAPYSVA
ncbi:neural cell adhesion molecule 1-A-like [Protopterus annectens]|uniref:neural cell adhesion molecule 1-A-like n=1 Tax=Protopterus annectens TaxID=7888 RepID=UPI001CFB02F1|nr:neural cell adhesion molecule 1-A-like [Protopterus annectens]